jgi:lysophospholipase L1-like esterase
MPPKPVTPKGVLTRTGKAASDVAVLGENIRRMEELLLKFMSSPPKTKVSVGCQTEPELSPEVVTVDAAVGGDCSGTKDQSSQTDAFHGVGPRKVAGWGEGPWMVAGRGKGYRRSHGGKRATGFGASSITVANRFTALQCATDEIQSPVEPNEVHLMGDSIVRGVKVGKPGKATTWCYPGTRVEHLTSRVKSVLKNAGPKPVVVVHAGTNNLDTDSPRGLSERLRNLAREVHRVRPKARMLISSILPRFDHGFRGLGGFPNKVLPFAREISVFCQREGIECVDASQELLQNPGRYYAHDGLHLTQEGKQLLGSFLAGATVGLCQGN